MTQEGLYLHFPAKAGFSQFETFILSPLTFLMTQIQTSKILNLSTEIITEIFKNFSTPVIIYLRRSMYFPWFLGQICARWRLVFLSMSTHFWGNIAISFFGGTAHPGLFKRAWDMLNFCLKNSEECQCPLSFSFGTGGSYYKKYSYVIDILDALLARSMRWGRRAWS